MASTGSRRGAAPTMSLILAIAAFLAIGGLIYWLNVTAEPTQTEFVPQDTASEEPVGDYPIVTLEQLRSELQEYVGFEVQMRGLTVNSTLGEYAFWVGPQDNPFLVMRDSTAFANRMELANGDGVAVTGVINEMSDSTLDAWEELGAIEGQGERAVASFAEVFMEAHSVERREQSGQQGKGSSGQGGQSGDSGGDSGDGSGGND